MLALGDDQPLAKMATKELKGAAKTAENMALLDEWYDLSLQQDDVARHAVQRRIAKLYRQLIPDLQALTLRRVEKRLEEIGIATNSLPKNEWVEILDLVELPKNLVENHWHWEGTSIVTRQAEHCKSFVIPVEVQGNYELRIRATKLAPGDGLAVSLSHPANNSQVVLCCYDGTVSGVNNINNTGADLNPSRTVTKQLPEGKPFRLLIQVDKRGDQVQINTTLENSRLFRWTGATSSLSPHHANWKDWFYFRHCGQGMAVHNVQLRVKSGAAWIVE